MTQYISKDAVLAEIDKLIDKGKYHEAYDYAYRDGNNGALYALKSKLNTLEVKEVDLEKEVELWYDEYAGNRRFDWNGFAKHFFELGLKVQKGE